MLLTKLLHFISYNIFKLVQYLNVCRGCSVEYVTHLLIVCVVVFVGLAVVLVVDGELHVFTSLSLLSDGLILLKKISNH